MRPPLENTQAQMSRAQDFSARLNALIEALGPYSSDTDAGELKALRQRFQRRVEDFFRENRTLTLAVAGRVKAGKSTFLNTLLFGGREVLPQALTPKTAVLTRMEYADKAALSVRFLTHAQWEGLCLLADAGAGTPQSQAARETVDRAQRVGAPLEEYFAAGTRTIPLQGPEGLETLMEEYVGVEGRYTPAVNSLTVYLPLDGLRGIAVIDTPGLNDPVVSRTGLTRQCLETCDAIFFLSRCGSFLDREDLELLTAQLPQKGAAKLVLVASQFDSALIDALPVFPSLEDAREGVRRLLSEHASASVGAALKELRRKGCPEPVLSAVECCRRPVFLSAAAESLSQKPPEERSDRERLLLGLLEEPGPQALERIGNFGEARALFAQIAAERDDLLRSRAQGLVAAARSELSILLDRLRADLLKRRGCLLKRREAISGRERELNDRIIQVRGAVEAAFAEYLAPLEETQLAVLAGLERLKEEWAQPEPREGVEYLPKVHTESAAVLLRPWTWGRRRTVYTSGQRAFTYLDPADGRRYLEQLSLLATRLRITAFIAFSETAHLQNRLMEAASWHFPLTSPVRQPERLRAALDGALSRLVPPGRIWKDRPPLSCPCLGEGPVRDAAGQAALLEASRAAAGRAVEEQRRLTMREAQRLQTAAAEAAETFASSLCRELYEERDALLVMNVQLERECGRLQEIAELLERYL